MISEALDYCMADDTSDTMVANLRSMIQNVMQLPSPEAISDPVLLKQLAGTFRRPIPSMGRLNKRLSIFLEHWLITEWKAHIDAKQTMGKTFDIRDYVQRALGRMFTVESLASLISNTVRYLVDERTGKLENDSKQRLKRVTYEQIEEEQQKQQQHWARLFALEAEKSAEEQAAKFAQGYFDGDADQELLVQQGIQQSLLDAGGTAQTPTSTESLSAEMKSRKTRSCGSRFPRRKPRSLP